MRKTGRPSWQITDIGRSTKFIQVKDDLAQVLVLRPWTERADGQGFELRWLPVSDRHRTSFPFKKGIYACLTHAKQFNPARYGLTKVLARSALTAAPDLQIQTIVPYPKDEKRYFWFAEDGRVFETPNYLDVVKVMISEFCAQNNLAISE